MIHTCGNLKKFIKTRPQGFSFANHRTKQLYLPMPKAGSTSLTELLFKDGYEHFNFLYDEEVRKKAYTYYIFTILRNPYERFISMSSKYRHILFQDNRERIIPDLLSLLKKIELGHNAVNPHYRRMSHIITDNNGNRLPITRFFKFEDLIKIPAILGIEGEMPFKNKGRYTDHARSLIESEPILKKRIMEVYKSDFDLYKEIF